MKVRPLHDRIMVERLEEQEVRRGGIIIPDTAKEKPQEGKVVAVGTGKVGDDGKKIPLDVKTGNKILFGKYSGSEVKIDDKEYLIMREEDVLAFYSFTYRAAHGFSGAALQGDRKRRVPMNFWSAFFKGASPRNN